MKKLIVSALLGATAMIAATPAYAGSNDGKVQVKLLATGVLPDGKITALENNVIGLPAGSQTSANDNVVPTLAIEYFASPNFSIETICCLTQHRVGGEGAIVNATILDHVLILPATVTLKYHLNTASGIKPYVGVGPSVFFYIDEKPAATTQALGGRSAKLDSHIGVALQAGVDIPLGDNGFGLSLDAKKYFMSTRLHVKNAAGTEVLTTKHKLDPWVLSGGVAYRF
ncbi:MAG: OmpW/AlkL family protein [Novosphingobium sp.]|jgi:outer membrane protein|nr:outer membrane beta-barrel protein [Brevundimonas sp.]